MALSANLMSIWMDGDGPVMDYRLGAGGVGWVGLTLPSVSLLVGSMNTLEYSTHRWDEVIHHRLENTIEDTRKTRKDQLTKRRNGYGIEEELIITTCKN